MKQDKGTTKTPLDPVPDIRYGAPRDMEAQVSFALASVRVVAGFIGASRYGTCNDVEDEEAAAEVLFRALEFLDRLDLSTVTMKPETEPEA